MRKMEYVLFPVISRQPTANPKQFPITALREIKLLKLLSHENVIALEDMAVEHPTRASKTRSLPCKVQDVTLD